MLPVVNMDENFFIENLFANSNGERSVDEMREDIEWKICEYCDEHEHEMEPVISPFTLTVVLFLDAMREADAMQPNERTDLAANILRERNMRVERILETKKG